MTIQVGVLTEGTASSSFLRILPNMFGGRSVARLSVADLTDSAKLSSLSMIVLPGIDGEDSPYSRILEGRAGTNILSHAEKGGILWSSCAPTYALCRSTEYHASNGTVKTRKGLGIIDADATGPVDRVDALAPKRQDRFAQLRCVPVTFEVMGAEPTKIRARLPYGNGPAMNGCQESEIMVRFGTDYDEGPGAIVLKRHGNGLVIASGILPELGLSETQAYAANGRQFTHVARMARELAPNEKRRQIITRRIRALCLAHHNFAIG